MGGVLDRLVSAAADGVRRRESELPISELEKRLEGRGPDRPFGEALTGPGISLVAEFKRRSPSSDREFRPGASVTETVGAYEQGGAAALSVLTDEAHFGGSLADLREARAASRLPILRKDFTVAEYQLYEAAVEGADAVLLIAAALEDEDLTRLLGSARDLDLDVVVEVHDVRELERALGVEADVIGINNRNLSTLEVDLGTTHELMPDVPAGKAVISESGISSREQVAELERIGVDAILVGEALMKAADPAAEIEALLPPAEDLTHERTG